MTSKDTVKSEVRLRISEALHQQIADAARENLRTINSEIAFRLRASLQVRTDEAGA